jgi:predicted phage-related endonuclease
LEQAVKDQQEAFVKMVAEYEKQGKALSNLQRKTAQIEAEKDQYLQIFRKHNLDKLALLKPGLVELRVNKATKEIFEVLENDTKEISTITSGDNND